MVYELVKLCGGSGHLWSLLLQEHMKKHLTKERKQKTKKTDKKPLSSMSSNTTPSYELNSWKFPTVWYEALIKALRKI